MVAAPHTMDAVERARSMPALRIGLHLVLVNGRPVLPCERIPDLVDDRGLFLNDLGRAGVRFFFRPGARRQLEAEIRAQFDAYAATGLPLDHVNAQNHMHVHPTVLNVLLKVGKQYGMRAVRIPREPFFASWRATHENLLPRWCNAAFLWPWLTLMQRRLRRAGLQTNDYVFGMNDSGRMIERRVLALLDALPLGISEMYFHPATGPWADIDPAILRYGFGEELSALISGRVADALHAYGIVATSYSDLAASAAP